MNQLLKSTSELLAFIKQLPWNNVVVLPLSKDPTHVLALSIEEYSRFQELSAAVTHELYQANPEFEEYVAQLEAVKNSELAYRKDVRKLDELRHRLSL